MIVFAGTAATKTFKRDGGKEEDSSTWTHVFVTLLFRLESKTFASRLQVRQVPRLVCCNLKDVNAISQPLEDISSAEEHKEGGCINTAAY